MGIIPVLHVRGQRSVTVTVAGREWETRSDDEGVARATEFAAREVLSRHYGAAADTALTDVVREDAGVIARMGRGRGETMTVANAVDMVRKSGFGLWLPVQAGVAEWMGDTKVLRLQRSLISSEQIATLPGRLEPGDILLERRHPRAQADGAADHGGHAARVVEAISEGVSFTTIEHSADADSLAVLRRWKNSAVAGGGRNGTC